MIERIRTTRPPRRIAGLMSGTSMDGIDVAIIDVVDSSACTRVRLAAFETIDWPPKVRAALLRLCEPNGGDSSQVCHYNFVVGELFARALIETCRRHRIARSSIDLIGSHGQTIWHEPKGRRLDSMIIASTLQIGEPAVIAERTGIATVADFRPGDMAAGGQGAPLVPYSDFVLFRHRTRSRAIQNIGGIGNVTWLPAGCTVEQIIAFDTGPGNMVIDGIISLLTKGKRTFDRDGQLAGKGKINDTLLKEMLQHPFFRKRPPKSTGREVFGLPYCQSLVRLARSRRIRDEDLLATVTALTANSIADAYRRFLPAMPDEIFLAGGGAHNVTLVRMLGQRLPEIPIRPTDDLGVPIDAREAIAFAILARQTFLGRTNNVPSATGARRPVILGKLVQAT